MLSRSWEELCDELSDEEFVVACKSHMRESRFFPCPADVIRAHRLEEARRRPVTAAPLEPGPSPQERHRSAICAAVCALSLANPKARRFFTIPDWGERMRLARQLLGSSFPGEPSSDPQRSMTHER